ncbi:MAG: HEPN domain-containing protein [Thermoplasmata archaeon]
MGDHYLDKDEFGRWIKNAKRTLESAKSDQVAEFYNWACFKAQQSAEFALKAFMRGTGSPSFGRSVSAMTQQIGFSKEFMEMAKSLDKYYIPTRYTDVWPEGIPDDYYTMVDAENTIKIAESIIDEVMRRWNSLKKE